MNLKNENKLIQQLLIIWSLKYATATLLTETTFFLDATICIVTIRIQVKA